MIDLHCHILPAIDDGAADIEDSVAMARAAADDGVTTICATPHIRHDHDVPVHELAGRVERLNSELARLQIGARVVPGGELAAPAAGGLSDDDLSAIALGGTGGCWLLLEPAPGPLDDRLDEAVDELWTRGYRSLVAHPERHLAADMRERLARLVAGGALVQGTAAMLLDPRTRDGMLDLAARGLIHVLGSDAHSSRFGRSPRLAAAYEELSAVEPAASHLDWIAETAPGAIVRGQPVAPPF